MKTKFKIITLCVFAVTTLAAPLHAAELSAADKQFLAHYEQVRAALAADNLADAKKAALPLGEEGKTIAQSDSIAAAREDFATISERAIKIAKGQAGYYVVRCPMLKKQWVQNATTISNPYAGKEMPTCGMIMK